MLNSVTILISSIYASYFLVCKVYNLRKLQRPVALYQRVTFQ